MRQDRLLSDKLYSLYRARYIRNVKTSLKHFSHMTSSFCFYWQMALRPVYFLPSVAWSHWLMASANDTRNSDEDFESITPLREKLVTKNQKIPVGHILASLKWRNTSVVQKMTGDNVMQSAVRCVISIFLFVPNYREYQSVVCFRIRSCRFSSISRLRSDLHICSWNDRGPFVQKTPSWAKSGKLFLPLLLFIFIPQLFLLLK